MKRPDKWTRMADKLVHSGNHGEFLVEQVAAALRRTDAAAEKRGIAIGFKRSCVTHTGGKS